MSRGSKRPKWMRDIAKERIEILFTLATKEFSQNPLRSHRYVELARNISKKYKTKIPKKWSHSYCKTCYKFLFPNKNSRVRLVSSEVHIKCHECNNVMIIPYKKEKKLKRRLNINAYIIQKGANEQSSFHNNN
ncbi:MAG: ribonuclease P [Methanobrevibacter sp.]|nr:ribonuclease P [Methanobrevibacter sp.]